MPGPEGICRAFLGVIYLYPCAMSHVRTVCHMKRILAGAVVLFLITGCSTEPEITPIADPRSSSNVSPTTPGGAKVTGPIMLDESDTTATVTAGLDLVVFDLPTPAEWTATLTPQDLATFQAGSDDSTMVSNPALYPLKEGEVTVVLTNKEGRELRFVITILPLGSGETVENISGPAEVSEAFGLTVLGMFEVDAVEAIENSGRVARIAERDGEGYALTKDYNPNRLNLVIVTGLVSSFHVG
jgi:hypothetical protein